jgi:hypothetical protein
MDWRMGAEDAQGRMVTKRDNGGCKQVQGGFASVVSVEGDGGDGCS